MGFAFNGFGRQLLCVIVGCALMGAGTLSLAQEKSAKVVVIVDHPALDAVRDGMLEELKRQDFEAGKKLRWEYQSAQGNVATAAQIARKFVGDNPDVIISIATPTSQALVAATKTVPIVYSAVTDPVLARLVPSLAPSGTNVTGVADPLPLDQQIALIKRVAPTAKRIGIVYNPGEVNSVSAVEELRKLLPAAGMTLVEAPAQRSADVSTAVRSLIGKIDLLYTNTDNQIVSAYDVVVKISQEAKFPIVSGSTDGVKRGAVAAVGINFHSVGVQTGKMVARILRGEQPGKIASEVSTAFELHVNRGAAQKLGMTLPPDLIKDAKVVIE